MISGLSQFLVVYSVTCTTTSCDLELAKTPKIMDGGETKEKREEAKFIYFDYASDILSLCLRRSCLKHQFCSIYPGSQLWYRARVSILARLIFGAGSFFLPYIIDVSSIPGLYPPDTIVSVFIPDL